MSRSRTLAAGGLAAATALGLLACSSAPAGPDGSTSITIAVPQSQFYTDWSPTGANLWFLTSRPVYEALITWDDEKNEFGPLLAKEYEVSADGLSISFTLREDVAFTDGTKLDAEAAVESLNTAFTESQWYAHYGAQIGLEPTATVTGEYTMEFTSAQPLYNESILLLEISTIPILGPAAIDDPSLVATEPIGTGAYLLEELVPDVSATYVRNPEYWNPEAYDFDEITIIAMADKVAALNALKSGQIDAAEIDFSLAAEAEASGLAIHTGPAGFTGLYIGDRLGVKNPPLGDVRVRQALNYAIDRQAIVDEVELGYGSTSSQPFDSKSPEYVEGGDDRYAYDPDRARELLAEAGYPDGFTIRLPEYQGFAAIDYAPIVEQYFSEIGVTIEWADAVDGASANEDFTELEVDGALVYNIFSNVVRDFAGVGQVLPQEVSTPELDAMIERYNGSLDEHNGVLAEFAEYILEQAWIVTVAQPEAIWASTPEVEVRVTNLPGFLPRLSWFHLAD